MTVRRWHWLRYWCWRIGWQVRWEWANLRDDLPWMHRLLAQAMIKQILHGRLRFKDSEK